MSKKSASVPTYKSLDQRSHVLHRPDMYIGTVKSVTTDYFAAESVVDDEKNEKNEKNIQNIRIVKKTGSINPGLHRIFIESLSNAIDNVWRSSTSDTKCTKIKIDISDDGEITVWNDGLTIPINIDPTTGIYLESFLRPLTTMTTRNE